MQFKKRQECQHIVNTSISSTIEKNRNQLHEIYIVAVLHFTAKKGFY